MQERTKKGNQVFLKSIMEEQEKNQSSVDIIPSDLQLNETETETEKTCTENNLEPQSITTPGNLEAHNEVITIVTEEHDREIYIYDRDEMQNDSAENSAEYLQVCESNTTFEEVNSHEDKEVNVDGIEEEEIVWKKTEVKRELEVAKEAKEQQLDDTKEENADSEGSNSRNFKNAILEDWEFEAPHVIENHESENCTNEMAVTGGLHEVTSNSESCTAMKEEEQGEPVSAGNPGTGNKCVKKENSRVVLYKDAVGRNSSTEKRSLIVRDQITAKGNSDQFDQNENDNSSIKTCNTSQLGEKRMESLKCPQSVTKEDIVKMLDVSTERNIRPIVGGKDLFLSIELTKRLNQKLSLGKGKSLDAAEKHKETDPCNNNNAMDDRQKIVEILEADEIKDWKSIPSKSNSRPKENGNDMDISNAIKSMEEDCSKVKIKTPRKTPLMKLRMMDKELERTLALQQLREEFPATRKRSRTSKKLNHVPFLASTVLEKAMTSPEVTTALKPGLPKRRPCYLPENATYSKSQDGAETRKASKREFATEVNENSAKNSALTESVIEMPDNTISKPVVKTYSIKRKSTDAESDIKTALEAVAKALNDTSEGTNESKPKKQKTVTKENKSKYILIKKKRKLKPAARPEKKTKSELEKLLGDEGAVRMLYDTQHAEAGSSPKKSRFKTTNRLKKDLVLKTKLVKNAVMRLSGVGTDGVCLRGKRRSIQTQSNTVGQEEEPLFSSTPNIVFYKPKKKQRAEASRILYRHSSSESFDSSEGYRRTSFDADHVNLEPTVAVKAEDSKSAPEAEKTPTRGRPKKSELLRKRPKAGEARPKKEAREKGGGNLKRLSTDSASAGASLLNLSTVPVRKSSRPRVVSKKYSIWSSTSMDSLSVESLGLKKLKKASTELGKKLNCKELTIMQYEHLVQIILTPTSTVMKNSLNYDVLQELLQVFSYLSEEESCRVALLSSRGSTFCQGIDINRIISCGESEKKKEVAQLVKAIREFVTCLASFRKPLIAGVQGAAVGLGVTLLPYCDLIVSSNTASFYTPYVKLGQAPEGAPNHTFRHINRQLVSELLFKSCKMTAADALKYGLVTQIVPEERFEEDLIMISRNVASQPVQGMQSIKFLSRKSERWDVSETLLAEGELLEEHWNSSECLSNMVRFLNSGELQLRHEVMFLRSQDRRSKALEMEAPVSKCKDI